MFRVELLPADYGDCIWITYGDADDPAHILIDAGTKPTFERVLRDRVTACPTVELFVVTHIDSDHIGGAIPLLEDGQLDCKDVWFNSRRHLARFLSFKEGDTLSRLIVDRQLPWNAAFEGRAVKVIADRLPTVTLPGGMHLTLLSPTDQQLGRLRDKWQREVLRHGLARGSPHQYRQFLARSPNPSTDVADLAATKFLADDSRPNGSSIAFLAEYDGRSVLFTGDAFPDVLRQSIDRLLEERRLDRLPVDALKVSHHGSRGNTSARLLEVLDCPRYLISSNGAQHNLPDNEAIGRLIHSRPGVELVFNYHCARTEVWDSAELRKRYQYDATFGHEGHATIDLAP